MTPPTHKAPRPTSIPSSLNPATGFVTTRSFHRSAVAFALLGVLVLLLGVLARPAAAQTIAVKNGATLRVAAGGVLDLHGTTLDFGDAASTARLEETGEGRVTGGLLTATRTLDAPSGLDAAGLGVVISSDEDLGETTLTRGHAAQSGGDNEGIQRYYDIGPTTNEGLDATLTFHYHEAELDGMAAGELVLFRSADGGATWSKRGYDSRDAANHTVTLGGIDAFSRWTLGSEADPLPVELTGFEATRDGAAVVLTWETASETNNAGFEVQEREKGNVEEWETLGFVEGAGTTTEPQSYRYRAEELDVGPHRFRLQQVDADGASAYSDEVEVTIPLGTAYRVGDVYPNPTRGRATLELTVREAQHVTVTAYDVLGRRVATLYDGALPAHRTERLVLRGEALPSGLYLVHVAGERFTATRRLTAVH